MIESLDASRIALAVLAAFAAGLVDAIAGGGGLITLPTLVGLGLPPHTALGTNKAQAVFGGLTALYHYARAGLVDRRLARWSLPLALVGAALGAQVVLWLSPSVVRPVVIGLLVVAAGVMALRRPDPNGDHGVTRPGVACLLAFVIAGYDGFFGPGTGTFLAVGLVALAGASLRRATADAKVINVGSNVAAFAMFTWAGHVVWALAVPMAVAQAVGATVGAKLALRGGARVIRPVVLLVAGALIVKLTIDLLR